MDFIIDLPGDLLPSITLLAIRKGYSDKTYLECLLREKLSEEAREFKSYLMREILHTEREKEEIPSPLFYLMSADELRWLTGRYVNRFSIPRLQNILNILNESDEE